MQHPSPPPSHSHAHARSSSTRMYRFEAAPGGEEEDVPVHEAGEPTAGDSGGFSATAAAAVEGGDDAAPAAADAADADAPATAEPAKAVEKKPPAKTPSSWMNSKVEGEDDDEAGLAVYKLNPSCDPFIH